MRQSDRTALEAQIARQTAELAPYLQPLADANAAVDAAQSALAAAQNALAALPDGADAETVAQAAADIDTACEQLAAACAVRDPLVARTAPLQSGIASCTAAIAADPTVTPDPTPSDDQIRAQLTARIKSLAGDHILATMPMWRQSNMHARNAELSLIKESRPLTADELADRAAMLAVWTWAKSVRAMSNDAEAALVGMTRAELDAWTAPAWPVFGA